MKKVEGKDLLKLPEVIQEIKRHLWIESEKAGYDIGFEKAQEDWVNKYSAAWVEYHMQPKKTEKKVEEIKEEKKPEVKKTPIKRSAKSYN